MRRVHLRGRENILKLLVVHSGAANLGPLMRKLFGTGYPARTAGCFHAYFSGYMSPSQSRRLCRGNAFRDISSSAVVACPPSDDFRRRVKTTPFTSGCYGG